MGKNSSRKSSGRPRHGGEGKSQVITDDRFASAQSDPRFMEAPKKRSKVEIDSRFHRMFTDSSFTSSNAPVDKRGKPKNDKKAASSVNHYYRLVEQENANDVSVIDEEADRDSRPESEQIDRETESESEKLKETLEEEDGEEEEDEDEDVQSSDESESSSSTDSDEQYVDDEEEDAFMQQVITSLILFSCPQKAKSSAQGPTPLQGDCGGGKSL